MGFKFQGDIVLTENQMYADVIKIDERATYNWFAYDQYDYIPYDIQENDYCKLIQEKIYD